VQQRERRVLRQGTRWRHALPLHARKLGGQAPEEWFDAKLCGQRRHALGHVRLMPQLRPGGDVLSNTLIAG
jgi:hypothetical protein